MFRHILIPTDGSPLSAIATRKSIELASALGARVTALHVSLPFHVLSLHTEILEDTREQYEHDSELSARRFLDDAGKVAIESSVSFETVRTVSDQPFQSIIDVARERGCDLIAMASHGRRGLPGLLIGSETQKVLTHTTIPVMVWR